VFNLYIPGTQNTILLVFRNIWSKVQLEERMVRSVAAQHRRQRLATCSVATTGIWMDSFLCWKKLLHLSLFFWIINKLLMIRKKQQELDFVIENRAYSDIPQITTYYK